MARGFKIADGYVEVRGEVDHAQIRRAAAVAGQESGDHFSRAMGRKIGRDLWTHFDRESRDGFVRVRSRLVRNLGESVAGIGDEGGRRGVRRFWLSFGDGLLKPNRNVLQALRTGVPAALASPLGVAALALGGAFAVSFVSAFIASAALGLIGTAIVGLGVLGAAQAERVSTAFEATGGRISRAFQQSAESMVEPVAQAAEEAAAIFENRLAPRLEDIFTAFAPAVSPLLDSIAEATDRLLGGIQNRADELAPLLVELVAQTPRIADGVVRFVDILVDSGPMITEAFEGVVSTLNNVLSLFGELTVAGTHLFQLFRGISSEIGESSFGPAVGGLAGGVFNTPGDLSGRFDTAAAGGIGAIPGFLLDALDVDIFSRRKEDVAALAAEAERSVEPIFRATQVTQHWTDAVQQHADASTATGRAFEAFRQRTDILTSSFTEAVREAGNLKNALDILNGGALAARAAERDFEAAIDAASEALKEHGANLDVTTEGGRAVESTLDAIAVKAQTWADAAYESTVAVGGHNEAMDAAIGVLQRGRDEFINAAVAAGIEREEAEKLADQILGIPSEWITEFEARAEDAKQSIEDLIRQINDIPKDVTITTTHINRFLEFQGQNTLQRYGGVHYARHGLLSGSTIFPEQSSRPLFGFAEPGTGGEAFIARNAPRSRSLSILDVAAAWHRAMVVPREATPQAAPAAAAAAPRVVEIPIYIGDEVVRVVRTVIDEEGDEIERFAMMETSAA